MISFKWKTWVMLMRGVAVASSSTAAIVSSMLPILIYMNFSAGYLLLLFLLLTAAAFAVHGVLTHAFNDYTDFYSGTDQLSPALLSGGSRVIQTGGMSPEKLKRLGMRLAAFLLLLALACLSFGRYEAAVLLTAGVWGAASYSLTPLRLSYRPFLGEWLSLFPSMLLLGAAAPWIVLGSIPDWAWQNAIVNALFCLSWVMVHHIPDIEADKQASPPKITSVVWAVESFGPAAARLPAAVYLLLTAPVLVWMAADRLPAAVGAAAAIAVSLILIRSMDLSDVQQVTACEKKLLLLAVFTAVWMGLFL